MIEKESYSLEYLDIHLMQTDIYVTKVLLNGKTAFSDLLGFLVLISSSRLLVLVGPWCS